MPTPYDCEARVNCNGFFLSVLDQVGCQLLDIIRFRIIHSFLDLFFELVVFDFVKRELKDIVPFPLGSDIAQIQDR